jgi:hypothetical protein
MRVHVETSRPRLAHTDLSKTEPDLANIKLLYATSARIGGGLDAVAAETLRGVEASKMDWRALAFESRELCARLGTAGRERVVNHFTWEHFRARLLEAYCSALAR